MDLKDRDEFDLLLACIRGEAEGEALWGKLAVACVVRNPAGPTKTVSRR